MLAKEQQEQQLIINKAVSWDHWMLVNYSKKTLITHITQFVSFCPNEFQDKLHFHNIIKPSHGKNIKEQLKSELEMNNKFLFPVTDRLPCIE